MKILTSLLFIIVLFFAVTAKPEPQPQVVVYEYKYESAPKEGKANELGGQGWELVAIQSPSQYQPVAIYVFKRVKK